MIYSLSEIDAHAKKATRGAGFEWGGAEEAGKMARLLAAYQLPGAVVLAGYLEQKAAAPTKFQVPVMEAGRWFPQTEEGMLGPLMTGACLCDQGVAVLSEPLILERVGSPLLVWPYLVLMSRLHSCSLALSWPGVRLVCHEGRVIRPDVTDDVLMVKSVDRVECAGVVAEAGGVEAGNLGQDISAEVWQRLDAFAKRTYVAATEASRQGAGPAD